MPTTSPRSLPRVPCGTGAIVVPGSLWNPQMPDCQLCLRGARPRFIVRGQAVVNANGPWLFCGLGKKCRPMIGSRPSGLSGIGWRGVGSWTYAPTVQFFGAGNPYRESGLVVSWRANGWSAFPRGLSTEWALRGSIQGLFSPPSFCEAAAQGWLRQPTGGADAFAQRDDVGKVICRPRLPRRYSPLLGQGR